MTGGRAARGHGLGDPGIPWTVLLDVSMATAPPVDRTAGALAAVARQAGWPDPTPSAVSGLGHREALAAMARDSDDVARVAIHPEGIVLGAGHAALDGLAMLALLGRLIGEPVRSTARGVDPSSRPAGPLTALLERAWEVGVRPQARVAASAHRSKAPGDVFAHASVPGALRTAELVRAGVRAVVAWNRSHRAPTTRVSVAVGVSTVGGGVSDLADHSAFLRIRHAERLDLEGLRAQVASAPLQPGAGASGTLRPWASAAVRAATRLASPRLGSSLLVSHLGTVQAPASVRDLAFYPVSGGGSGLSLGAATVHERTTITLRARAARHDDEGLRQLLALVVDALR